MMGLYELVQKYGFDTVHAAIVVAHHKYPELWKGLSHSGKVQVIRLIIEGKENLPLGEVLAEGTGKEVATHSHSSTSQVSAR